jgi:nodulation protein E
VNRVVVTGWGVLSSIGHTAEHHWSNLVRGVCGIAPAVTIPTDQLTQKVAAEVKNYEPLNFFTEREVAPLDRVAQFGVIAAREAIAHSGLTFEGGLSEQTATIIGCGVGGQSTQDENYKRLYRDNAKRLHPLTIPRLMVNAPAAQISIASGCAVRPSWCLAHVRRRPMPSGSRSRWCARARFRLRSPAAPRPASPTAP